MMRTLAPVLLVLLPIIEPVVAGPFELTERIVQLSYESAKLSALAYEDATEYMESNHDEYEEIEFYTEEPDQAVLAKKDGRCYVAFRGTSRTVGDWIQNLNINDEDICKDNDVALGCCETRQGFSDFVRASTVTQASDDLMDCVASCTDKDDCVVLTGHSQGGASAAILSILIYSLKPTVITFGMPPAIDKDCDLIPSERFYRYVNFFREEGKDRDVAFDPVPFVSTLLSKSEHYGHFIMLGPDESAVKYLGFDQDSTFSPAFVDNFNEVAAHSMSGTDDSYLARFEALLKNNTFPVSTEGFRNGVACKPRYAELCGSGSCQDYVCKPSSALNTSVLCLVGLVSFTSVTMLFF